ncbi:hypothetical protein D3P09_16110 [Paenibacillus pinisoli]|uniref:Amidohydrolase-related domain-containing protein n=1 Tax=Paenibacillus pinisoli TaxID=1276110 RepID=A0A3A6PH17_9BACL|nr:hypothetical protein D3P09_16110 [Paenibacillus pinisoli]
MYHKAGIPALHVLQMTTLNGSGFLGRMNDMGTVDIGKNADLILNSFVLFSILQCHSKTRQRYA